MLDYDLQFIKVERDTYKLLAEHFEEMYKIQKAECDLIKEQYEKIIVKNLKKEQTDD